MATKRTVVAMPECSIGLVPDVGAAHFLGGLSFFALLSLSGLVNIITSS